MSANLATWTAIATACGTFVVVILQGLNIEGISKVKSVTDSNESELKTLIEENNTAIQNQKKIIAELDELKAEINKPKP